MEEINFKRIEHKINSKIPKEVKSFFGLYKKYEDFGLKLCDESTMINYENILRNQGVEINDKLLPILNYDKNDFAAIYLDGELKGMICIIKHDELDKSPSYTSIWSLLEAIKNQIELSKEDLIDFYDIEKELPLFGSMKLENKFEDTKNILFAKFNSCSDSKSKNEIALKILKLANDKDYTFIKENLLRSKDMWIQEEVINIIKRNLNENYLKDIFEILEKDKVNPLIATAILIRENKDLKNSNWAKEFTHRFPEIAYSYLRKEE